MALVRETEIAHRDLAGGLEVVQAAEMAQNSAHIALINLLLRTDDTSTLVTGTRGLGIGEFEGVAVGLLHPLVDGCQHTLLQLGELPEAHKGSHAEGPFRNERIHRRSLGHLEAGERVQGQSRLGGERAVVS